MNYEEHHSVDDDVIFLISCAVNEIIPDKERIEKMDLGLVYKRAESHMLTAAVAIVLESAGIKEPSFVKAEASAIRKAVLMDKEQKALLGRMEEAGIWYMPLKGAILKDFYPACGMREMADRDILFDKDRQKDLRRIMEQQGFVCKHYGTGTHDCYEKPPVCNFEMHRRLTPIEMGKIQLEYYADIKNRLVKDEGNRFGYRFTPEDLYIYIIAHAYKHYSVSGTGLRSLLDIYICQKKLDLDMEYVRAELKKLGIEEFEESVRSLSLHLFAGESLTTEDHEILEYILSSGTYGNLEHGVTNRINRLGGGEKGRTRYLRNRLFMPMDAIEAYYPFFYRHKILLPGLFFYRIGRAMTRSRKKVTKEIEILKKKS